MMFGEDLDKYAQTSVVKAPHRATCKMQGVLPDRFNDKVFQTLTECCTEYGWLERFQW